MLQVSEWLGQLLSPLLPSLCYIGSNVCCIGRRESGSVAHVRCGRGTVLGDTLEKTACQTLKAKFMLGIRASYR